MAPGNRLFGTAGIRGRYLEKITPDLAFRIGLAVASYVGGKGSATIGHDVRTTSPLLAQMVAAGIMAGGLDSIFLGPAPTPVLAFSVPYTQSRSGIMVTASHNPPPDNGIKVFDHNGMEYTTSMEKDLEETLSTSDPKRLHAPWNEVGRSIRGDEIVEEYSRKLVNMLAARERRIDLNVAVDCANGAASPVTPRVLREIGAAKVVSLNCHMDGFFPGRHPEPRPDVLAPFISSVEVLGSHILFAHDGDADRLAVAIPGIGFVKQDLVIALFAWWKLRERKGTVIVSVDVGMEVEEVVENMGGRVVRARLGKLHEKLKETPGAVIAAEPWKLIDPDWGPWVDGIYQAALISRISLEEGEKPASIIRRFPFYPSARISIRLRSDEEKISFYGYYEEEAKTRLTKNATGILTIDGLRVEYEDRSWILIRMSGTEPKIRIYAQATSKQKLLDIIAEAKKIAFDVASKVGVQFQGIEEHIDLGDGLSKER